MWVAIPLVRLTFVTSEDSRLAVSLRREMELWHRPPITAIRVLKFCRALSFCSKVQMEKSSESYPYILSMNAWQHWVAYILFPVNALGSYSYATVLPNHFPIQEHYSQWHTYIRFPHYHIIWRICLFPRYFLLVVFGLRMRIDVRVVTSRAAHKVHLM